MTRCRLFVLIGLLLAVGVVYWPGLSGPWLFDDFSNIRGNDFLRGRSKSEAEQNIRAMVKLARDRGVDVLLIGAPERGLTVTPPGFYAEVAKAFGIPYEGAIVGQLLRDADMKSDPIHPNARGYRAFAERIAERLRESGAL